MIPQSTSEIVQRHFISISLYCFNAQAKGNECLKRRTRSAAVRYTERARERASPLFILPRSLSHKVDRRRDGSTREAGSMLTSRFVIKNGSLSFSFAHCIPHFAHLLTSAIPFLRRLAVLPGCCRSALCTARGYCSNVRALQLQLFFSVPQTTATHNVGKKNTHAKNT